MSSHSDAVSRIVLEFPGSRRTLPARSTAVALQVPRVVTALAELMSYMELIASRCLSASRPLRVAWSLSASIGKSSEERRQPNRKVRVDQIEESVELKVQRSVRRAKMV